MIGKLKIKIIEEILINGRHFHSISNMAENNSFTCITYDNYIIVNTSTTKGHSNFCNESEYVFMQRQ